MTEAGPTSGWASLGLGRLVTQVWGHMRTLAGCCNGRHALEQGELDKRTQGGTYQAALHEPPLRLREVDSAEGRLG